MQPESSRKDEEYGAAFSRRRTTGVRHAGIRHSVETGLCQGAARRGARRTARRGCAVRCRPDPFFGFGARLPPRTAALARRGYLRFRAQPETAPSHRQETDAPRQQRSGRGHRRQPCALPALFLDRRIRRAGRYGPLRYLLLRRQRTAERPEADGRSGRHPPDRSRALRRKRRGVRPDGRRYSGRAGGRNLSVFGPGAA